MRYLNALLTLVPLVIVGSFLGRNELLRFWAAAIGFELIALFGASLIAALVALDGESNWLEGAQLLVVYAIIGMAFFYLPV